MYIGSTGQRGLHHLVFEVLDNAIDEVRCAPSVRRYQVRHADAAPSSFLIHGFFFEAPDLKALRAPLPSQ